MFSYVVSFLAMVGFYGVSRDKLWGYYVGLIAQPIWLVYGLILQQPGLVILSVFYFYINLMGVIYYGRKNQQE